MNAVFAHDHVFSRCPDGKRYSPGKLPYDVLRRYLRFFDSLTVLARERSISGDQSCVGMSQASGAGVSFHALPSLSSPISRLRHFPKARRTIHDVVARADVVIARLPSEIGSLTLEAARSMGKPVAVEVVACHWDALWNYGTVLGKVYAPLAYMRTRRHVRRAPFVIYVSRQFLPERYPCDGATTSVSDVQIAPVPAEVLERRLRRIHSGTRPIRLGLIGGLLPYKGIDTALRALARMPVTARPLRLFILGAGDQEPWKRLARRCGVADRVEFCGVLPAGAAVNAWLDDIDIYMQPSRQEGLPRALAEAMSRGCPCIGSTAGGIPELLDATCLHAPGSSSTLARLLARATADREWQVVQARRNFSEAQLYTRDRLDRQWNEFWAQFAATARRQRTH